jgi:hypothetical protein
VAVVSLTGNAGDAKVVRLLRSEDGCEESRGEMDGVGLGEKKGHARVINAGAGR